MLTAKHTINILLFLLVGWTLVFRAGASERCYAIEDSVAIKERSSVSFLGADLRPSYAFSSFRDDVLSESLSMDNAAVSRFSGSYHLKYGLSFTQASEVGRLYPGVRQGVGVGVNIFQYPGSIGVPVPIYLFQGAPICNFGSRLSLDYEWNFGFAPGWKPCNGIDARSNLIVGSKVNAYINLNVGLRWQLTPSVSLTAGMDLTHFSNGNTTFPNPGVNLLGLRLGMVRSFGIPPSGTPFTPDTLRPRHKFSYDLTAYGAWRCRVYRGGEKPLLLNGKFGIAGISFAPMWNIRRFFRAGLAGDFQWDGSSDQKRHYLSGTTAEDIRFSKIPFFSQVSLGLSARAELVMPFFSLNIGMGYNFIGPYEAIATYQLANLKVYVTRSLFLNIGYQLQDFQRQNNLMLGLGYTFRSNRVSCTSLTGK